MTWRGEPVTAGRAARAQVRCRVSCASTESRCEAYQHGPSSGSLVMRRAVPVTVLSLIILAIPLVAQTPQGQAAPAGPGMGRFQPPPDHWMTMDSLSQALSLSGDQ